MEETQDIPVLDAHMHVFEDGEWPYPLQDATRDIDSAPSVRATIYMECNHHYRRHGPEHLRCVGETEFVAALADSTDADSPERARLFAGIVGKGEFGLGTRSAEMIDAHVAAGKGRFRGLRLYASSEPSWGLSCASPEMLRSPVFRQGLNFLGDRGLTCDVVVFPDQMQDIAELAAACPNTSFVINHLGKPNHVKAPLSPDSAWARGINLLAAQGNVYMKVGGLLNTYQLPQELNKPTEPLTALAVAAIYKPYVDLLLDNFGAERCMFESNFPIDRAMCGYAALWKGFMATVADRPRATRASLLGGTASTFYNVRLEE